jgi:ferredoxin-type protein NapH
VSRTRRSIPIWPFRRTVQLVVLAMLFLFPILARYSHYLSARQIDKTMERWDGSLQGNLLEATDSAIRVGIPDGEGGVPERRPRKAILERTRDFYGSPWSARVFGVSMTDLLAGGESMAASVAVAGVLLLSLLVPLIATLLLGRVFCGWICPGGLLFDFAAKVRTALVRGLELRLPSITFSRANKYIVLGVGLLFALILSVPVLHYLYPPALIGRETHSLVMAQFDRAEAGWLGFAVAGLTGASLFLLALVLIEILIAPRFFCQAACPGGALYSLLGRFRLLRVRRKVGACTECTLCDQLCPRGLQPMADRAGSECDSCGVCLDVCKTDALKFRFSLSSAPLDRRVAGLLVGVALLCLAGDASAHHILGIPHYAYDENYPQAPVLKLKEQVGPWEVQLTGYPGNPQPGERSQVHAYLVDEDTRALYRKPVTIYVRRQWLTGQELIHGPVSTELEENVFKFYFTYPEEGQYEIMLAFHDGEAISTLRFPMVVGDPGSPWATVGWFGGGLLLFVLVIRAVRIKMARARRAASIA